MLVVGADISFNGVLVVMVAAVVIPLLLGLFPKVPLPASVLEIVAGVIIGPEVLGWVSADQVITVLARLGVAFLLFLGGLELDFRKLKGRTLELGLVGFVLSMAIGLVLTLPLRAGNVIVNPLLVTIILASTSVGIVIPVLKDGGQLDTAFGTAVVASASVAEFGSIVAMSMFFSGSGSSGALAATGKLAVLVLALLLIAVVAVRAGRWTRLQDVLQTLQDTSAQIRVRVAVLALMAMLALSQSLKFDAVLGAFMAGALISALTDPHHDATAADFCRKLEAIGHGFVVPVFFVATGITFPLHGLFADSSTALRVPLFLGLLLAVRGSSALLFRGQFPSRLVTAAALFEATSLSFIVVGTEIGVAVGQLRPVNAASLVAAGMLSVLLFPPVGLALLSPPRLGTPASGVEPATPP